MSRKSNFVAVRLTDEERSKLEDLAQKRNSSISVLVREMVVNCRLEPVQTFKVSSHIEMGLQHAQG